MAITSLKFEMIEVTYAIKVNGDKFRILLQREEIADSDYVTLSTDLMKVEGVIEVNFGEHSGDFTYLYITMECEEDNKIVRNGLGKIIEKHLNKSMQS